LEEVIVDVSGEGCWSNVGLEAFNLIGARSCVKVAHGYWDIFGFIVVENIMELIPELVFTVYVGGRVLDRGWSINRKPCNSMWSGIEDKNCDSRVPGMEIINNWEERCRDSKAFSGMWIV